MKPFHRLAQRVAKHFVLLTGLWSLGFWTSVSLAEVTGEAYWGSFGERSGRLEGVFLKSAADDGLFIGFDEELEVAAFSFDVDWDSEERFEMQVFSRSSKSSSSQPTRGAGRTFLTNDGVLLESDFESFDLQFEAFSKSSASLIRYRLEGETEGELLAVLGVDGRSYALFLDDSGFAYGGEMELLDNLDYIFETKRGDRFEIGGNASNVATVYQLNDGRQGKLISVSSIDDQIDTVEPDLRLKEVWSSFSKKAGVASDSLHLILSGSGETEVGFRASVTMDVRDGALLGRQDVLVMTLLSLGEGDEWQELFSSLPLIRMKNNGVGEFDIVYAGFLSALLGEGTYLVQISGLYDFAANVETRAAIAESASIGAVNSSVFYPCMGRDERHLLGFEFAGDGVASAIVRNVGPGLRRFDVDFITENPALTITRNGVKSWLNDDWGDVSVPSRLENQAAAMGAFPLMAGSLDAAMSLSIGEGRYEASAAGASSRVGFEIIELYCEVVSR